LIWNSFACFLLLSLTGPRSEHWGEARIAENRQ
jgi:hypothetical protein